MTGSSSASITRPHPIAQEGEAHPSSGSVTRRSEEEGTSALLEEEMEYDEGRLVHLFGEEPPIHLPDGMKMSDWMVERIRWQNPRIRALLGCIRLLGGVLESNYAILHCSPERLLEIFRKVRQVSELIRSEIAPLMTHPSRFPNLEEARQRVELSMDILSRNVLRDLENFPTRAVPEDVTQVDLLELRKLLCVSIGKLHAFLQDSFGEILANDPRSSHDADYFLSKRFPQDLEEAEWLHSTVKGLASYLATFESRRSVLLDPLITEIRLDQTLPADSRWEKAETFLDIVLEVLTPKLKEVLALRGIRFYEMEILDRYATDIPTHCRLLKEVRRVGREVTGKIKDRSGPSRSEREQSVEHLLDCHGVCSERLVDLMIQLNKELRDLVAFVPIWLDSIQNRRALLLRRGTENPLPPGRSDDPGSEDTAPILI